MPFIPLIAAGIGAALTVGKMANDNARANQQNRISADEMQYSPWTHMNMSHHDMKASDPFGTAAQGAGVAGNYVNDAMSAANASKNLTPIDANTQKFQDEKTQADLNKAWQEQHPAQKTQQQGGANPQPLAYSFIEGQEGPYNSGRPIYSLSASGTGYQDDNGGPYRGYDDKGNSLYWSSGYGKGNA